MAERRMFSKTIIDSDMFLDMPTSSRLLYFDLSMRADDDGFVNSPKKIIRMTGASQDDLKLLIAKNFIIPFESGVVVIKHWKIHNYIRNDRYKPTMCQEEKSMLSELETKEYVFGIPDGRQLDTQMDTQDRLGKDRLGKSKEVKHKYGEYLHVLLSDTEKQKLLSEHGEETTLNAIKYLDEYIETSGKKYKNHYLVMKKWVFDAVKEKNSGKKVRDNNNFERRQYSEDMFVNLQDN